MLIAPLIVDRKAKSFSQEEEGRRKKERIS